MIAAPDSKAIFLYLAGLPLVSIIRPEQQTAVQIPAPMPPGKSASARSDSGTR
jgi:hypothetical protein